MHGTNNQHQLFLFAQFLSKLSFYSLVENSTGAHIPRENDANGVR